MQLSPSPSLPLLCPNWLVSAIDDPNVVIAVELSGDFVNWLVSDEARFLRGRFVAANWDAEELLQMREKIEGDKRLFTMNLVSA